VGVEREWRGAISPASSGDPMAAGRAWDSGDAIAQVLCGCGACWSPTAVMSGERSDAAQGHTEARWWLSRGGKVGLGLRQNACNELIQHEIVTVSHMNCTGWRPLTRCVRPCIGYTAGAWAGGGVPGARGRRAPRAPAAAWSAACSTGGCAGALRMVREALYRVYGWGVGRGGVPGARGRRAPRAPAAALSAACSTGGCAGALRMVREALYRVYGWGVGWGSWGWRPPGPARPSCSVVRSDAVLAAGLCRNPRRGPGREKSLDIHPSSTLGGFYYGTPCQHRGNLHTSVAEMAGRPAIAPPESETTFLGRLSMLFPRCIPASYLAAQFLTTRREFAPAPMQPVAISPVSYLILCVCHPLRDATSSFLASNEIRVLFHLPMKKEISAGQGAASDDVPYTIDIQNRAKVSTATAFRTAVNDSAICSMLQLGDVQRRLEHTKATCTVCKATAGVLDTCRCAHGELLCFSCDDVRHATSPCLSSRHALLRTGHARNVLIALHANDWIAAPERSTTGFIGDASWIRRRGKSS